MSLNDVLANVMTTIKNHEMVSKPEVFAKPASKVTTETLKIMQKAGFIGEFEIIENGKGGLYKIILPHRINGCGVIKPRFPVKVGDYEKWEQRFLPGNNIGLLIVSTPKGIMNQKDAKKKGLGGVLLAYIY
jgi:small subunit ribosomal protein S8